MVQNKHFKARIRERMAKTGECYTAARRHLLPIAAAAPGTLAGLLPGYRRRAVPTQRDAALWSAVLAQAGVIDPLTGNPFSEAMLAGLAGGIGFMMFTFEYQQVTTATVVTRFHPGPYVGNLISRSGATIEQQTTGSPAVASTRLEHALDAGAAVVVRLTPGRLTPGTTPEYDESADVVVAGRTDGQYLIDDGGRVEARGPAELAAARAGRKADKHWQAHVTGTGPKDIVAQEDHVRSAIRDTAEALLNTHGQAGIPDRFNKNFGVSGMRTWAERLRDTRSRKGWPAMFAGEQRRVQALTQVQGFLAGDEWSGSGALRALYAGFLQEAAEIDGLAALRDVAPLYEALGTRWDGLADMIDPDCPAGELAAHFADLAENLDSLALDEEAAAKALLGAVY